MGLPVRRERIFRQSSEKKSANRRKTKLIEVGAKRITVVKIAVYFTDKVNAQRFYIFMTGK